MNGGGGYLRIRSATATVLMNGVYCDGNDASNSGGCLYLYSSSTSFDVYNLVATYNTAVANGGAVLYQSDLSSDSLHIHDSYCSHNSAVSGGAIFTERDTSLSDCAFVDNSGP